MAPMPLSYVWPYPLPQHGYREARARVTLMSRTLLQLYDAGLFGPEPLEEEKVKYLICFGGLWRVTEKDYRRLQSDARIGAGWNLDDYGVQVASEVINVTDSVPYNHDAD